MLSLQVEAPGEPRLQFKIFQLLVMTLIFRQPKPIEDDLNLTFISNFNFEINYCLPNFYFMYSGPHQEN